MFGFGNNQQQNNGGMGSPRSFGLGGGGLPGSQAGGFGSGYGQGGSLSLAKQATTGETLSLTKDNPNLNEILIGLKWDISSRPGVTFDIDHAILLLDQQGRSQIGYFTCFDRNHKRTQDGSVFQGADNLVGGTNGEKYSEQSTIKLSNVDPNAVRILIVTHIYDARKNAQTFAQVSNASITIEDVVSRRELINYNLTANYGQNIAIEVAELVRNGQHWDFKAVGRGLNEEYPEIFRRYGLPI
ncbi:TerD family protein [Paenibacillus polymyxa]|uniref:TerD family protein n=1 Tax=Paenibacillus polymyxa TaxID=1406 RepID=UPI0001E6C11A|nr:TerD family protein [Paenibacillus polymyxa]WPQ59803.1 TerD family protein [Paenibacillus polymyxa]